MPSYEYLHHLSLIELRDQCIHETANYFWGFVEEPGHCYEIFRRAIVEKSEEAWDGIIQQYSPQVTRWVKRHPKFHLATEETEFFVNRAFEKFWRRNLSASEFSQFPNVKSLMGYLKTCVASVMTDYWRVQERKRNEYVAEFPSTVPQTDGLSIEERVEYRLKRRRFWTYLRSYLPDAIEFQVVYAAFALGLKPVEIFNLSPEVFGDVNGVYRIKARAMSRLSRVITRSSHFLDDPEEME